jgi:predicted phage-related endonuclease
MSILTVHNMPQGSPEWFAARLGIPTASMFAAIVDRKKDGKPTAARQKYLFTLAGQRITGKIVETYSGGHLARGTEMEDEARKYYVFQSDQKCEQIGFVTNSQWRAGASPDSFIGSAGLLEIKTKLPDLLIACLESDEVPEDHIPQVQGQLGVTGRAWCDFTAYWPGMPKFIKRVERDESYIARLKTEVAQFNDELDALVRKYS